MAQINVTTFGSDGKQTDVRLVDIPDAIGVQDAIRDALTASLVDNRAFIALTPPTNAQLVTQVKQLAAQNNRLIRLLLGMLDAAN